jgi:predicted nuclease of predicted toxin-antitoxin system
MKILLDSCVWGGAKKVLETSGYDTKWTGDLTQDPGDAAILNIAYQEQRVLVTLDKDFGKLAIPLDSRGLFA